MHRLNRDTIAESIELTKQMTRLRRDGAARGFPTLLNMDMKADNICLDRIPGQSVRKMIDLGGVTMHEGQHHNSTEHRVSQIVRTPQFSPPEHLQAEATSGPTTTSVAAELFHFGASVLRMMLRRELPADAAVSVEILMCVDIPRSH